MRGRRRLRPVKSPHVASTGAARIPVRIRATAGLAVTAAIVVVAGCATVPSGGAPQQVNAGENQVQAYLQQLPPPGPEAYHNNPGKIVLAFLHACASYAFDPAAVRQFLVPTLRAKWRPRTVTVLSSIVNSPTPKAPVHAQQNASSAPGQTASVELTGQRLAILSQTGQYQYSPRTSTYPFSLQNEHGVWLISALPPGQDSLLLLQDDFERVYQARNLFFFARWPYPGDSKLVPDPVYVADSALNTNLASALVRRLISDQRSWLNDATQTAFPRGTRLNGIAISGQTAVVDLGGAAAHTSTMRQQDMAEQLQATLSSTAYSPALARFLQLEINGRTAETVGSYNLIDNVMRGPVVYQSAQSSISAGLRSHPPSAGPAEFGSADITAIAMSPGNFPAARPLAVAAKDGNGCRVYVLTVPTGGQGAPTRSYHGVRISTSGGQCTSLSWDNNGNLWAAAGQKVWVLQASYNHPQAVALPPDLPSSGHRAPQIIALRMAPDAVRAALLIKSGAQNRLLLTAVHEDPNHQVWLGNAVPAGTGLHDPKAMSWYSPYDLMVLDDSAIAEVSLAGGAAQRLGSAPRGAASLTTDGVTIVVGAHVAGTSDYEIWTSSTLPTSFVRARQVSGAIPIYPG
jgi:Lipoprotein LpqB beta-propeller domain/Sporulation and spore germination